MTRELMGLFEGGKKQILWRALAGSLMLIGISGFIWKGFQNNTIIVPGHNVTDGKESFGVKKLLELVFTLYRSMKYFHAIASFAKQVNKIRLLKVLLVEKLL